MSSNRCEHGDLPVRRVEWTSCDDPEAVCQAMLMPSRDLCPHPPVLVKMSVMVWPCREPRRMGGSPFCAGHAADRGYEVS